MTQLLIITSEPLNPADTLSSTFELTQAEILSAGYDTAILSVASKGSVSSYLKKMLKLLAGFNFNAIGLLLRQDLWRAVRFSLFNKGYVNRYTIEGVVVYEGCSYSLISRAGFGQATNRWVKAGLHAFAAYKKECGRPALIHAHGRFLYAGVLALAIKKQTQINYIYTEHSTFFKRGIVPRAAKPYLNEVIDHASAYISVSQPLLEDVESWLGRKIAHPVVAPNALDRIFELPAGRPRPGNRFVFINIASLDEKKGIDILIRSFAAAFNNDARYLLYVCGDGPLEKELIALRDQLGLKDSIVFTGRKSKQDICGMLDQSHAFVLSSRVETFGVVVMEALSRGCPVIATRCGGPEYLVTDNDGLLVEPGNVEQLAGALKKMAASYGSYDPAHIRQAALNKFGAAAFLHTMTTIYKSIRA